MKEVKEVKVKEKERKANMYSFYQENADLIRDKAEQKKVDNSKKVVDYHSHVLYSI